LLSAEDLVATRGALAPYLAIGSDGRNDFEGDSTQRVYSRVGRGAVFEQAVLHPEVLALVDQLLQQNYLLTASQTICLRPSETPQPLHYDDTFYAIARPRPAISVSTIWALDDFTAVNGGAAPPGWRQPEHPAALGDEPPVLRTLGPPTRELHPLRSTRSRGRDVTPAAGPVGILDSPPIHGPGRRPPPR